MVQTVRLTIEIRQLLWDTVIDVPVVPVVQDIPVVTQRPISMVLVSMEIPQLLLDMTVYVPVVQDRADFPCRGADAVSHGPDCSSDHGISTVCLRQGDRCPCCAGRERSTGAVVEKTVVFPQLHSLRNTMCSDLCESGHCLEQLIIAVMS